MIRLVNKVAIIGAGAWGTALAVVAGTRAGEVAIWARRAELAAALNAEKENRMYLPGVRLGDSIHATADMEQAVARSEVVVVVTPSHAFRDTVRDLAPFLPRDAAVVSATKGLEEDTLARMSEIMRQELPGDPARFAVLSGPNFAIEVGRGLPTASVVAASSRGTAEYVQDALMAPWFRLYTNPDVVGVELGGALKNIIAIGVGIADGLEIGQNGRAGLITRGLAEIARLGIALGARSLTFAGLAGLGDLVLTCTGEYSRNRRAGLELGRGKTMTEILATSQQVIEGFRTARAARVLSQRAGVEMPITEQINAVLFRGRSPADALAALMAREKRHEIEEVAAAAEW